MAKILHYGGGYLVPHLRDLGHEVFSVGSRSECDFVMQHPMTAESLLKRLAAIGFQPDFFLYADDGNLPFLLNVEKLRFPSIFYSIDTFCNPWHIGFAAAFDLTLVAQKDYVPLFKKEGWQSCWMPLFFSGKTVPQLETREGYGRRDIPVSFVGTLQPRNIPSRLPFLKEFRNYSPLVYMQGDYRPIFARSCIVLNQTAVSEVNFRCFEAMSLGAALLIETCQNGLEDLFIAGKNILPTFPRNKGNIAASIARYWLERPEELATIALAGQQLVLSKHGAAHRAQDVSKFLDQLARSHEEEKRLSDLSRRSYLVGSAYGMIAAELLDEDFKTTRDFFFALQKAYGAA